MTQALALRKYLADAGHEVVAVLIGKSPQRVIPDFVYKKMGAPIFTYDSPNFLTDKNNKGVQTFKSIVHGLSEFGKYWRSLKFLKAKIAETQPDVIINFYEILTGAHYLLCHPEIPLVCVGHQYFSEHPRFKFPPRKPIAFFYFRAFTALTSYGATAKLALSFKSWEDVPVDNLYIVPPLLRPEVLEKQPEDKNFLLVYMLNAGYAADIIAWREKHPQQKISVFCDRIDPAWPQSANLIFNPINDEKFIESLSTCSGYLSTAGFESICEAAYFGKPVFAVPTYKHFEQECNALDIVKSGLGLTGSKFRISDFLTYLHNQKGSAHEDFKSWVKRSPEKFLQILENINARRS